VFWGRFCFGGCFLWGGLEGLVGGGVGGGGVGHLVFFFFFVFFGPGKGRVGGQRGNGESSRSLKFHRRDFDMARGESKGGGKEVEQFKKQWDRWWESE